MKKDLLHYQACVAYFLDFYKFVFGVPYGFKSSDGQLLKGILKHLKSLSEAKNYLWDEAGAVRAFALFLHAAASDPWIKDRLDLKILSAQMNRIILTARKKSKDLKKKNDFIEKKLQEELLLYVDKYADLAADRVDLMRLLRQNFNYKGLFWRRIIGAYESFAVKEKIALTDEDAIYSEVFWGDCLDKMPQLLEGHYIPLL